MEGGGKHHFHFFLSIYFHISASLCVFFVWSSTEWNALSLRLFSQHIAAHTRGCCPALRASGVDRAAQPGAMGAPSYVQPDHWDQASASTPPQEPSACGAAGSFAGAQLLPLSVQHIRLASRIKRCKWTWRRKRRETVRGGKSQTFFFSFFFFFW